MSLGNQHSTSPARSFEVTADDGVVLSAEAHGPDDGPTVLLLHGGGDRASLRPLARRLSAAGCTVLLPDVRGYGRSVCRDPDRHTWARYVGDVGHLLDANGRAQAVLVGAGLGSTIALRTATDTAERVAALALISPEDIEDDEAKAAETALMDRFAELVRTEGLTAAWSLYLPHLDPLIGSIVREALPRADRLSAAAAAAVGHDRAFCDVADLARVACPTVVIAGADARHPAELARRTVHAVADGRLSDVTFGPHLSSTEGLADAVAPDILRLVDEVDPT